MLERGMEKIGSAPWSFPALHLCTILHLKKVGYVSFFFLMQLTVSGYFRDTLDDVEIRALRGPCHHFQDFLFRLQINV